MARPLHTYAMYRARIFSQEDQLLAVYSGTLPAVHAQCSTHFLAFDSVAVIRRQLDKTSAYAKAYHAFNDLSLPVSPCFVHLTLAKS